MVSVSFVGLRSPQRRGENLNSLTLWGGEADLGFKSGKSFQFFEDQVQVFQNFIFKTRFLRGVKWVNFLLILRAFRPSAASYRMASGRDSSALRLNSLPEEAD